MVAVAAGGFQGVAHTGRFSDPPLASKNGPRGRAGHRPLHLPGGFWPRPRVWSTSAGHRNLSTGAFWVSSGHRASLNSVHYWGKGSLGAVSHTGHHPGTFYLHVPGIAWRRSPCQTPDWASEPLALCWGYPRKTSFWGLACPAQPVPEGSDAPGLWAVHPRTIPAAHSLGWRGRQEHERQVPGLSEAPSGGHSHQAQRSLFFLSQKSPQSLKASSAKCIPRLRE